MKIALLSWEAIHGICVGGVGVHVTELAAALERRGHEVHVFTRMSPGSWHYQVIDGVRYHRCPFALNWNFVDEINNMCRSFVHHVYETENVIGGFDIIHAHDWLASNAGVWIKEGKGRRFILTLHSSEYGRCGNNFWGGQSARIREHERHGTYCADRVITVSQALKNEIMWMYNVPDWKVSVIHNGINPHRFDGWLDPWEIKRNYGMGPLDPMILFSGRMVYQKGPDLLTAAIPHMLHYYPHAKFVFAGDGEMKGVIEEQAWRSGVHHACRFLGHRNGVDHINLYKAADVVCVPSRNEPFGIVILEGWSAGKPVVATDSGGPGEVIWHNVTGLKVYPNPESIAWGLGTLAQNFEHGRWLGKNGRVAAETAFSWDTIADRVEVVYRTW